MQSKIFFRIGIGVALLGIAGCGGFKGDSTLNESGSLGEEVKVSNVVGSVKEMSVGDVFYTLFDPAGAEQISFAGVDKSATFILGVANVSTSGEASQVKLSYDDAAPLATLAKNFSSAAEPIDGAHAFHEQLRAQEIAAAGEFKPTGSVSSSNSVSSSKSAVAEATSATAAGKNQFRLIKSLSGSTYQEIIGDTVCEGENVIIYLDGTFPSELSQAELAAYCDPFDLLIEKERKLFGGESDINGDQKVAVLFTPMVNALSKSVGGGGTITGYFYFKDLQPRSAGNPTSNLREIVYLSVPDGKGKYGPMIPKEFYLTQFVIPVFVHEFQHAINFNQKAILHGVPESMALNEGLSHFAEDRLGHGYENPSRTEFYLEKPESYPILGEGSPNLGERGGIYLFLRWLYEQSADGDQFVWDLLHTHQTGAAAVEGAFRDGNAEFNQVGEFFLRFATSVVMSNLRLSIDPTYSFQDPVFHEETGHYEGAFLAGDAHDGRGTVLEPIKPAPYFGMHTVSLAPTAFKLYEVTQFPKEILLSAPAAGEYAAFLIRTK